MSENRGHLWVDCGFEVKAVDEKGRISGLGAAFGNVDLGLDKILPGAFTESLKRIKAKGIPMLWQHFADKVIGLWDTLTEVKQGLAVQGQINMDVQQGIEARSLAQQGALRGLSIGYIPKIFHFEDDVRVLEVVDVMEVSLATFPMNTRARVVGVKNDTPRNLERLIREELGLSKRVSKHAAAYIRTLVPDGDMLDEDDQDTDIPFDGQGARMLKDIIRSLQP